MAPTVYAIVPKPDAVIVIKVSTTRFAVWDTADETETTTENTESDAKGEESKTVGPTVSASSADHISRGDDEAALATVPYDTRVSDQEEASQVPIAGEITTEEVRCDESDCDPNPTPNSSTPATECGDDPDAFRLVVFEEHSAELPHNAIHYQVSSEHLKVASPILAHMINADNKVGGKGGVGGCYYIILEDCDEEALHILLKILHLKNREVPRKMNLDLLAKLSVLIDRYECTEAVEVFLGMWTEAALVIDPVPSTYCRKLVLWLYVAWVVKMPRTFKETTATAIELGVDGSLRTMGLPIPASISNEINHRRNAGIDGIHQYLQEHVDKFRRPNYVCPSSKDYSFQCGAISFGALIKEMDAAGFLSTDFKSPFEGLSAHEAKTRVTKFKPVLWADPVISDVLHGCNMVSSLKWVSKKACGLTLKNFEQEERS